MEPSASSTFADTSPNRELFVWFLGKVLKPGRHEFDFNFTLPNSADLPPSLKINNARIHYEFITSLKRPRDDFKIYQTPFYVTHSSEEYMDQDFDEYCHPSQAQAERSIAQLFGCCLKGDVALNVKLQRRIFPVGGTITFIVNVRNNLRSNLDAVKVNLIRVRARNYKFYFIMKNRS